MELGATEVQEEVASRYKKSGNRPLKIFTNNTLQKVT